MSSSDRGRGDAPGARPEPTLGQPVPTGTPAAPADPADPYPNWLDRMQRARARHAAITKNLYTWSSYKNWADKMRDNWEDDESANKGAPGAGPAAGPGPGGGHGSGGGHGPGGGHPPGIKPPIPRK